MAGKTQQQLPTIFFTLNSLLLKYFVKSKCMGITLLDQTLGLS